MKDYVIRFKCIFSPWDYCLGKRGGGEGRKKNIEVKV